MEYVQAYITILIILVGLWGIVWFFFRDQFRYHAKNTIRVTFFSSAALMLMYCFVYKNGLFLTFDLCNEILLSIFLWRIWKYNLPMAFFFMLTVKNFHDCVLLLCGAFFGEEYISFAGGFSPEKLVELISTIILYIILVIVLYLVIQRLIRPLMRMTVGQPLWNYLWLMPLFFYLMYRLGIYEEYGISANRLDIPVRIAVIWGLGTLVVFMVIVKMILEMQKTANLQDQLTRFEMQIAAQYNQIRQMQESVQETRRQRHDLRHYLLLLQGYAQRGELKKIESSIQEYIEENARDTQELICENPIFNSILLYYRQIGERSHITVEYDVRIDASLPFQEKDLAILLSNLLENAIEASIKLPEDERRISCQIHMVKPYVMMVQIQNRCQGMVLLEVSEKGDGHGIGLSSVRKIAEKYDGVVNCEDLGGQFRVSVLLHGKMK